MQTSNASLTSTNLSRWVYLTLSNRAMRMLQYDVFELQTQH